MASHKNGESMKVIETFRYAFGYFCVYKPSFFLRKARSIELGPLRAARRAFKIKY
jgi:hypothetical protein